VVNPNIILTNPPATITAILFGMLALLYDLLSFDSFSSPSRFTKPPNGIALNSYSVSLPLCFHILGPNPIANSFTFILHIFATI